MPDFSHLLRRPAGKAVRPKALPMELYPGIIKGFEYGDSNRNKTPYVRFHLGLVGWPDSIPDSSRSQPNGDGTPEPIDLSKRRFRTDLYTTDDALWRLDEFLRSCGVDLDGRSYEELIPTVVGCNVTVEVQQYLNQTTNEIGNQVGRVFGSHQQE